MKGPCMCSTYDRGKTILFRVQPNPSHLGYEESCTLSEGLNNLLEDVEAYFYRIVHQTQLPKLMVGVVNCREERKDERVECVRTQPVQTFWAGDKLYELLDLRNGERIIKVSEKAVNIKSSIPYQSVYALIKEMH